MKEQNLHEESESGGQFPVKSVTESTSNGEIRKAQLRGYTQAVNKFKVAEGDSPQSLSENKDIKQNVKGLPSLDAVLDTLLEQRQKAGFSQRALAKELGWHQNQINRFEGRKNKPSEAAIQEYASALGYKLTFNLES